MRDLKPQPLGGLRSAIVTQVRPACEFSRGRPAPVSSSGETPPELVSRAAALPPLAFNRTPVAYTGQRFAGFHEADKTIRLTRHSVSERPKVISPTCRLFRSLRDGFDIPLHPRKRLPHGQCPHLHRRVSWSNRFTFVTRSRAERIFAGLPPPPKPPKRKKNRKRRAQRISGYLVCHRDVFKAAFEFAAIFGRSD